MTEAEKQAQLLKLTQTVQSCLEAGHSSTFDAAVDVAGAVSKAYTDKEVDTLRELITDGSSVDLSAVQALIKLLDGDESAEGFQKFEALISDVQKALQLAESNATAIQQVGQTTALLGTEQERQAAAIKALEEMEHGGGDCCLEEIEAAMSAACQGAKTAMNDYFAARKADLTGVPLTGDETDTGSDDTGSTVGSTGSI